MPPEEFQEVRQWLLKARHDLWMAEAGLERVPPILDGAAFHCQQCAEKLIKAYLVYRAVPFERVHDLRSLLEACVACDAAWETVRDDVEPLTAYAVRFRYPGPPDPPFSEVRGAHAVVIELEQFLRVRIPAEFWS